jgi:cytochrome c oxidase subunit IV
MADTHSHTHIEGEIPKPQTAAIWRTFWVLLGITALEFAIAFLPYSIMPHMAKVGIYVILTIAKAFYIVAEFMHLKHEVKFLAMCIVLPMIFIVWLLIAMVVEGGTLYIRW